jgi:hypothetical protein
MDVEPPPSGLAPADCARYGYSIFSARYGNVYSVRQLLQMAQEAFGFRQPENWVWSGPDGKFWDALRPGVEPLGLDSEDEVRAHREQHIRAVRQMLETVQLFVFTMGLTEAWVDRASGSVYPTAPGTIAGSYDPDQFVFCNFTYQEVMRDFLEFRSLVRRHNANTELRFLITVSPVPLAATATDDHVLSATLHSKSVLRAAAGELARTHPDVDYFPSFEIVVNPWASSPAFEADGRTVREDVVSEVMRAFLSAHHVEGRLSGEPSRPLTAEAVSPPQPYALTESSSGALDAAEVICEEAILSAFADSGTP